MINEMQSQMISLAIKSRNIFFYFVKYCNDFYSSGHGLESYSEIIDMHRQIKDIETMLNNEDFFFMIYRTLEEWGMDKRGADLNTKDEIKASILRSKPLLIELYKYKLHDINSLQDEAGGKIISLLNLVFKGLEIMKSKRQIVGSSKTLHFLLPDLILPMDGEYTMPCFFGYNKYSNNHEAEAKTFKDIFIKSQSITKMLRLGNGDVDGVKWNTSIPKLIDNAMIGLCNHIKNLGVGQTMSVIKNVQK